MASIGNEIIVKQECRPCWVNGKKGLFHRWLVKKNIITQGEYAVGIIEFENGVIREINSENIFFCDRKIKEYGFNNKEREEE